MWLTEGENRIILENKDKNTVRLAAGKASEKTQGTLNRRENLFSLLHILKGEKYENRLRLRCA